MMENSFSAICTACGMCCDGTLFNKAKIVDEVDEVLVQSLGLETFTENSGKRFFKQPCPQFKGCCAVYEKRPNTCDKYLCRPLREVERKEISLEAARKIIEKALACRAEILAIASEMAAYKNHTIADLMAETRPQPTEQLKKHPNLWLKVIGFQGICSKIIAQKKS